MSIVFAAHCPHTSLFLASIAKEASEKLKNSLYSFAKLEKELYSTKPQILVIISNNKENDYFSINAHKEFETNFEEFGEYNLKKKYLGANDFAIMVKNNIKTKIKIYTEKKIDNPVSIPLFFLADHLKNTKILIIETANLSKKEYLDFGKELKKVFIKSSSRIAVIASGNLSHSIKTESPAGYTKEGLEYDKKIIELLESHNSIGIANLNEEFIKNAHETNYYSLLLLISIIQNMNYEFKNLSYEAPFGVGYLSGFFDFE